MADIVHLESNRLMPALARLDAATGTSAAVAIPTGWAGAYVTLKAEGGDVVFRPGDSSVQVDPADSDATKIGWKLDADESQDFRIPPGSTHLAIATPSTSANLRWALTSDQSGVQGAVT